MHIAVLLLRLFLFYCYDVYRFGVYTNYVSLHRQVTNFIKETVIVQFINVVWIVTERLEYLKKELASILEVRTELSSNFSVNSGVTSISKNERSLQTSPVESGIKGTGSFVSEFPMFIR